MKRRAKLTLVPNEEHGGKSDPDLGIDPPETAGPQAAVAAHAGTPRGAPTGTHLKRAAKVLLLVAVSALSIYLLRRRLPS